MGQMTFKVPPPSTAAAAQPFITKGFQANQHCKGRGDCPYEPGTRKADWWDQGWCEAELIDLPPDRRAELEIWLAAGND